MNDFTKKELIALEDAMQHMQELNPHPSGDSPLRKKIEEMIDKYCEHEWKPNPCDLEWYCTLCEKRR